MSTMSKEEVKTKVKELLEVELNNYLSTKEGQELRKVIKWVNFHVEVIELDETLPCFQIIKTVSILFKSRKDQEDLWESDKVYFGDDDKAELLFGIIGDGDIDGIGTDVKYDGENLEYWVYTNQELVIQNNWIYE